MNSSCPGPHSKGEPTVFARVINLLMRRVCSVCNELDRGGFTVPANIKPWVNCDSFHCCDALILACKITYLLNKLTLLVKKNRPKSANQLKIKSISVLFQRCFTRYHYRIREYLAIVIKGIQYHHRRLKSRYWLLWQNVRDCYIK